MEDESVKRLAKDLVVHCFRNTHLEDLHADLPGFTNEEMKKLMIETVDNTYTFLHAIFVDGFSPEFEKYVSDYRHSIRDWNEPKLVEGWTKNKP